MPSALFCESHPANGGDRSILSARSEFLIVQHMHGSERIASGLRLPERMDKPSELRSRILCAMAMARAAVDALPNMPFPCPGCTIAEGD